MPDLLSTCSVQDSVSCTDNKENEEPEEEDVKGENVSPETLVAVSVALVTFSPSRSTPACICLILLQPGTDGKGPSNPALFAQKVVGSRGVTYCGICPLFCAVAKQRRGQQELLYAPSCGRVMVIPFSNLLGVFLPLPVLLLEPMGYLLQRLRGNTLLFASFVTKLLEQPAVQFFKVSFALLMPVDAF